MAAALAFILAAYLLGSLPQVYWLGRLIGKDLRRENDLHIALWDTSRPLGIAGIIGDLAKGPLPVVVAMLLGLEVWVRAGAGLGVVVGQMWPLFLPSTGGKGNSTGLSMSLALAPVPLLLAVIPMFVGLAVRTATRRSRRHSQMGGPPSHIFPVGMLASFIALPLLSWRFAAAGEITLTFLALLLVIIIRRLTAGLRADLKTAPSKGRVLLNRFLYDRSFLD